MNQNTGRARLGVLSFLSLFTSISTLLCCALPALLVSLGMGLTLASLASTVPWIFELSHYKGFLFTAGAVLLAAGFLLIYGIRAKTVCEDGTPCRTAGVYTRIGLWMSLALYVIGFFMAYLYLPLLLYFES